MALGSGQTKEELEEQISRLTSDILDLKAEVLEQEQRALRLARLLSLHEDVLGKRDADLRRGQSERLAKLRTWLGGAEDAVVQLEKSVDGVQCGFEQLTLESSAGVQVEALSVRTSAVARDVEVFRGRMSAAMADVSRSGGGDRTNDSAGSVTAMRAVATVSEAGQALRRLRAAIDASVETLRSLNEKVFGVKVPETSAWMSIGSDVDVPDVLLGFGIYDSFGRYEMALGDLALAHPERVAEDRRLMERVERREEALPEPCAAIRDLHHFMRGLSVPVLDVGACWSWLGEDDDEEESETRRAVELEMLCSVVREITLRVMEAVQRTRERCSSACGKEE